LSFLKLLMAFAPWIAFLIIAHGSLFRLKLGLVIAFALCVVMGVTRLHRGVILWAGLCFFTFATIAVVMFENMWTVQHMGVLASGTLAVSAGASLAIGKPFTLDYAREHTDSILWNQPEFLRTNFIITLVWTLSFTANALLAWGKMVRFLLPELGYEALSYTLLVGTAAFTTWYQGHVNHTRHAPEQSPSSAPRQSDC
jgi:uncharacterized membrane protein